MTQDLSIELKAHPEHSNGPPSPDDIILEHQVALPGWRPVKRNMINDRTVMLLNPRDIDLFDDICAFQNKRIESLGGDPIKTRMFMKGDVEELALAKKEFYSKRHGDALVKLIYQTDDFDYILRWQHPKEDEKPSDGMSEAEKKHLREQFEYQILARGMFLEYEESIEGTHTYVKVMAPFQILLHEAARISMRFALKARDDAIIAASRASLVNDIFTNIKSFIMPYLQDDVDYTIIRVPLRLRDLHLFEGANIADLGRETVYDTFLPKNRRLLLVAQLIEAIKLDRPGHRRKITVENLLLEKVYTHGFVLHDGSYKSKQMQPNARTQLFWKWVKAWDKTQPLNDVMAYFGTKIGLYFAWLGFYTVWLGFAALIGVIVFIYGLTTGNSNSLFDNELTAPFALFLSLWATLFLEFWKRKNAIIAYNWDVRDFEKEETPRPAWYGTKLRVSTRTGKKELYYPHSIKIWKVLASLLVIAVAIGAVIAAVAGTIVFRAFSLYVAGNDAARKTAAQVGAAFLNLIAITVLGYIYGYIAQTLNDWENHRTQTEYEDALIFKKFLFNFINSYASLFYVGFIKQYAGNNIAGNPLWKDQCSQQDACITDLTIQLIIVMVGNQFIQQVLEVLLPFLKRKWFERANREIKEQGLARYRSKVAQAAQMAPESLPERLLKPPQWTKDDELDVYSGVIDDFNEMAVQFGFTILFAVAFPLAPLFSFVNNLLEIRTDAFRLTVEMQRPVPRQAQDIGSWERILSLLSHLAVISNAFLVGFTSSYVTAQINRIVGRQPSDQELLIGRLVTVVIFEHVVFAVKFVTMYLVPEVPGNVRKAIDREEYRTLVLAGEIEEDEDDRDEPVPFEFATV